VPDRVPEPADRIALLGDAGLAKPASSIDMQAFLLRWYAVSPQRRIMFDQRELDWFVELNARLHDTLDDAGVRERLRQGLAQMRNLAATTVARAKAACPQLDCSGLPSQADASTPLFTFVA
jgi:hypothetical protein